MENLQNNQIKNYFRSEEINIAFANVDYTYRDKVSQDCVMVTKSGNRRVIEKPEIYQRFNEEYDEWSNSEKAEKQSFYKQKKERY